jgi:phosphoadenosine phosphosulfate reductase
LTEIWKNGAFAEDEWIHVADDDDVPPGKPVLVSLPRWRSDRQSLSGRNAPIGLVLEPDADWRDITADLPRFPVIAVAFPKYADGRGFSIARLLRERDGYAGEIRAFGDYFTDQMPYLRRVGFDAFVISDPHVRKALERGVWPEVPVYLQPIDDASEVPAGTRPWVRRPGGRGGSAS